MKPGFFVTGTDTEVGKTYITVALLRDMAAAGLRVAGYKPVAAGADYIDGQWRNEDGLSLQAASAPGISYERINPMCLPLPMSPHLAARAMSVAIDMEALLRGAYVLQADNDIVIVEGAGGWRVPLDEEHDVATFAARLGWPVVLVVGLRLGCINHARLAVDAMRNDGVNICGWIANAVDVELLAADQVLDSLIQRLDIPLLAYMAGGGDKLQWTEAGAVWRSEILQIVFDSKK